MIYDTKFGNCKRVSDLLIEGIKEKIPDAVINQTYVKKANLNQINEQDCVLIGGPVHAFGISRTLKSFAKKLAKLNMSKPFLSFSTYIISKNAVKTIYTILRNAGWTPLITPGLPIKVEGMKGPLDQSFIPKIKTCAYEIVEKLKNLEITAK